MSPQVIGFIKGLAYVVIFAVLSFVANATNLTAIVSPQVAAIIAGLATALLGSLDGHIEMKTGKAVFGAVPKK